MKMVAADVVVVVVVVVAVAVAVAVVVDVPFGFPADFSRPTPALFHTSRGDASMHLPNDSLQRRAIVTDADADVDADAADDLSAEVGGASNKILFVSWRLDPNPARVTQRTSAPSTPNSTALELAVPPPSIGTVAGPAAAPSPVDDHVDVDVATGIAPPHPGIQLVGVSTSVATAPDAVVGSGSTLSERLDAGAPMSSLVGPTAATDLLPRPELDHEAEAEPEPEAEAEAEAELKAFRAPFSELPVPHPGTQPDGDPMS